MPKKSPEQKAEEEKCYIAASGAVHAVFHNMYIANKYLDKPTKY